MKTIVVIILVILAIIPVPTFSHILTCKQYREGMSWNRYVLEWIGILVSFMVIEYALLETISKILGVI